MILEFHNFEIIVKCFVMAFNVIYSWF